MEKKIRTKTLEKIREEVERASNYYYHTPQQQGIDNRMKRFVIERCEPYIIGPRVLELGYIDGIWTDMVLKKEYSVDVVEGATKNIQHARQKYSNHPSVTIYHQLFQEFDPTNKYNTILAADIIRYIPSVTDFLRTIRNWLESDGHLIVTVPNSRSLHRRIGSLMKMEPMPTSHNLRDFEVGNLRSYDRYELRSLFLEAGYTTITLRGCFLKPLSSQQMEDWDDELLRAFLEIGDELEDYCWFIYSVCKRGSEK
jgi:2-polyprenyl-3-methyl-5-hydroxy-6-metoxy-1,4-benzoquinol methylase